MAYRYRDVDDDEVKRHAERTGDYDSPIKGGIKLFKGREGKNKIRILGYTWDPSEGPKHWALPLYLHYGIGADNASYACRAKMGLGDCVICDERRELDAAGDKEDADKLRPNATMLVYVVDRNREEDGPVVFKMPAKKLEAAICGLSRDEETQALIKIDHPEKGYDVTFDRKGTGLKTEYSQVAISRKQTPLSPDKAEMQEWLDYVEANPLTKVINVYSNEYIAKVFSGKSSKRDDDPDPEPTTRSERSRSRDDDAPRSRREPVEEDPDPPRASRRATNDDEKADIDAPAEPARRRRSSADDDEPEGKDQDRETSRGRTSSERGVRGDDEERPRRAREEAEPLRRRSRD